MDTQRLRVLVEKQESGPLTPEEFVELQRLWDAWNQALNAARMQKDTHGG